MAVVGVLTVLALAYLLSTARGSINFRTIGIAFAIQASLAALIIYVPAGQRALAAVVGGGGEGSEADGVAGATADAAVVDAVDAGRAAVYGGIICARNQIRARR